MRKLALYSAIGAVVGVLLVWWIQPETPGGATFIVTLATLLATVLGSGLSKLLQAGTKPPKDESE